MEYKLNVVYEVSDTNYCLLSRISHFFKKNYGIRISKEAIFQAVMRANSRVDINARLDKFICDFVLPPLEKK